MINNIRRLSENKGLTPQPSKVGKPKHLHVKAKTALLGASSLNSSLKEQNEHNLDIFKIQKFRNMYIPKCNKTLF